MKSITLNRGKVIESTQGNDLLRAVIYCSVSTKDQVQNLSLETQQRTCREFCSRQDWAVDRVFVEQGESAKTANRTELKNLLAYCREHKGRVHCVVVYAVMLPEVGARSCGKDPIQCLPMGTIAGTLYIRWENDTQALATPRYKLIFSRYKNLSEGVHITSREGLYNLLVNYRSGGMWSPQGGAQPSKLLVGSDGLESYLIDIGFRPDDAKDWVKQIHEKGSVSIPNVMMPEEQMSEYER